jgi:hypothetical protein
MINLDGFNPELQAISRPFRQGLSRLASAANIKMLLTWNFPFLCVSVKILNFNVSKFDVWSHGHSSNWRSNLQLITVHLSGQFLVFIRHRKWVLCRNGRTNPTNYGWPCPNWQVSWIGREFILFDGNINWMSNFGNLPTTTVSEFPVLQCSEEREPCAWLNRGFDKLFEDPDLDVDPSGISSPMLNCVLYSGDIIACTSANCAITFLLHPTGLDLC